MQSVKAILMLNHLSWKHKKQWVKVLINLYRLHKTWKYNIKYTSWKTFSMLKFGMQWEKIFKHSASKGCNSCSFLEEAYLAPVSHQVRVVSKYLMHCRRPSRSALYQEPVVDVRQGQHVSNSILYCRRLSKKQAHCNKPD